MRVFVIGHDGTALMPCKQQKARKLIEAKKATVYQKNPYTIKLCYQTGIATQPLTVGVDTGSQNIGIAVISNKETLYKAEIKLRSTMEKRVLLETRRQHRRGRRYRKVRFRKPKFRFTTKRVYSEELVKRKSTGHLTHWVKAQNDVTSNRKDGWLPPSVQSKVDHHVRWINQFLSVLPKQTALAIEVGRFDMARMKNPNIHNELYQYGVMYDKENVKAYVFDRDRYRCIVCGAKLGTKRKDGTTVKGKVHHILYRSKGATDNPEYLATVCDGCHTSKEHLPGGKLYKLMKQAKPIRRGLRDATMMNIVRVRLGKAFPTARFTYGNITKVDREQMLLAKSHANDAVAIASRGRQLQPLNGTVFIKQVRKKKRSLHEATPRKGRTVPNRESKRNSKNTKYAGRFSLYDTVRYCEKIGYITGFTGTSVYVQDFDGKYITMDGKSYKQIPMSKLVLIRHNNNWITKVG